MNNSNNSTTVDLLKIIDICPGVKYLINQNNTVNTILQVNVSSCENNLPQFTSHQGVVYGVCDDSTTFCKLHVKVPQGMYVRARVQRLAYWCQSTQWSTSISTWPLDFYFYKSICNHHSLNEIYVESSENHMPIKNCNNPLVKIEIEAEKCRDCIVKHIIEYSGYLIVPYMYAGWDQDSIFFVEKLKLPSTCTIMVSIQQSGRPFPWKGCSRHIKMIYRKPNATKLSVSRVCFELSTPTIFFLTSYLNIQFSFWKRSNRGLKIHFSTLPENIQPQKLSSGYFNCSVNHYTKYQRYLECNLKSECEDGRDETEHCPFSSPDCQGLVASRNKCLKLITLRYRKPLQMLGINCQVTTGGRLASIKTRKEQENVLHLFKNYDSFAVPAGYSSGGNYVPFVYSKFRKWSDNTFIYFMNHFSESGPYHPMRSSIAMGIHRMVLDTSLGDFDTVLCEIKLSSFSEFPAQVALVHLHSPQSVLKTTRQFLCVCPDSHVTHPFLVRDPNSYGGKNTYLEMCAFCNVSYKQNTNMVTLGRRIIYTYPMFKCDDDITLMHYSLVCDFRQDCPDNSDESFCEHPLCDGILCLNGQCLLRSQRCNAYSDCLDDSDDFYCNIKYNYLALDVHVKTKQRFYINLDGTGYFTQKLMEAVEPCPDTHYRCTAEWLYCLPVYTRCNGFSDCVYGEDEHYCDRVRCPGLYWCRGSKVCVHGDHLCDGWGQCPHREDELMCDMTCPEGCQCEGHSFLCSNPFPADHFPQLRCVEAKGSRMTLNDFNRNAYLIRLSLSYCSLGNISGVKLTNLQFIDLSNNHLTIMDLTILHKLSNLKIMLLSDNPLRQLANEMLKRIHYALKQVNIAKTHHRMFNTYLSLYLPYVKYLNASFTATVSIGSRAFKNIPQLTKLDIRGNRVNDFPMDLLSKSTKLHTIYSSNYRFCCEHLLPKELSKLKCLAPHTVFLSCKNLIPNQLCRLFFWMVSTSAILGNCVCFVASCVFKRVLRSNFVMVIVHLQLANTCMGSHVGIAIVADKIFRGKYIQFDKAWINGLTCKVNAFISLLSTEVSVLIIWFITLDHIIALSIPVGSWRCSRDSTAVATILIWFTGILLALIPFLPGLSNWGIHDQSGLCRLALFDRYDFGQKFRWFTVSVFVNFVFCLMTVAGQIIIYKRIPKFRITLDPTKRPVYTSVHLMGKVSITDAACWFSFGVVKMMSATGIIIFDKIHDGMVVFLLPLNSALNPFLCMWAVASQRRQQKQEDKLLEVLKLRMLPTERTCKGYK